MNIAVTRLIYEDQCRLYATSEYRNLREYSKYLDRFLHSEEIVDGMAAEERKNKLPMNINAYFMG